MRDHCFYALSLPCLLNFLACHPHIFLHFLFSCGIIVTSRNFLQLIESSCLARSLPTIHVNFAVFYCLKGWYWLTIGIVHYNKLTIQLSFDGVLTKEMYQSHLVWLYSTLQDGFTALHLASFKGHQKVVELLLDNRANPNLQDKVKTVQQCAYQIILVRNFCNG